MSFPLPAFLKKAILRCLPYRIPEFGTCVYSQEGEDIILQRIFMDQSTGFFIDVGAHHPCKYSNTYLFYKRGWRGINIDAMPGSMKLFKTMRPEDTNLEIAVGQQSGERTFHIFNEPALNSFDFATAQSHVGGVHNHRITAQKKVSVRPLSDILSYYLPDDVRVDFLTVDVEGLDLEVLKSNDWKRFRPGYILVECLRNSQNSFGDETTQTFLEAQGYEFFAKTVNTSFFVDKQTSA